jgi:hypothetical protein
MSTSRTITTTAALLGASDAACFLARRRGLFRDSPGRAGGSAVVLAAWLGLAGTAARGHRRRPTTGLAAAIAAAQAALLAVHLKHGVASPRVVAGTALGVIALGAAATAPC